MCVSYSKGLELSSQEKKRSFQFIFYLPLIDIPDYSPVDTIVELRVHTANAVFVERNKTYNLIGK